VSHETRVDSNCPLRYESKISLSRIILKLLRAQVTTPGNEAIHDVFTLSVTVNVQLHVPQVTHECWAVCYTHLEVDRCPKAARLPGTTNTSKKHATRQQRCAQQLFMALFISMVMTQQQTNLPYLQLQRVRIRSKVECCRVICRFVMPWFPVSFSGRSDWILNLKAVDNSWNFQDLRRRPPRRGIPHRS
jgi:hypothetical protein